MIHSPSTLNFDCSGLGPRRRWCTRCPRHGGQQRYSRRKSELSQRASRSPRIHALDSRCTPHRGRAARPEEPTPRSGSRLSSGPPNWRPDVARAPPGGDGYGFHVSKARSAALRTRSTGSLANTATTGHASCTPCAATTLATISLTRHDSSDAPRMTAVVALSSHACRRPRAAHTRGQ